MASIILALALMSEVTDADILAYSAICRTERPQALAVAKKELIAVRRDRSIPKEQKQKRVAAIQESIKKLGDRSEPYYAPLDMSIANEPGLRMGWVDSPQFRCISIVDKHNSIAEHVTYSYRIEQRGHTAAQVGPPIEHTTAYWLTGFPTVDMVDDRNFLLRGVVKIGEHKSYEAADGSNRTLPVIEAVDIEKHIRLFAEGD